MTPIDKPVVDTQLAQMNGLQRAAESFRYVLLCAERWISPEGSLRSWLRVNCRLCAWLLIPALFVLPAISFILWQLAFWWSLFTGIVGKLFLVILVLLIVRKMTKR